LQQRLGQPLAPLRRGETRQVCLFPGCGKLVNGLGLCSGHYKQARDGRPLAPLRPPWPNAGYIDNHGYRVRCVPGHPNAHGDGKRVIREHVLVMSQMLGRPLAKGEQVHHKNGIRHDNRPVNLELWTKQQPAGQRVVDKLAFCVDFINTYSAMLDDGQRLRLAELLVGLPQRPDHERDAHVPS
jgi:hypothetical protein